MRFQVVLSVDLSWTTSSSDLLLQDDFNLFDVSSCLDSEQLKTQIDQFFGTKFIVAKMTELEADYKFSFWEIFRNNSYALSFMLQLLAHLFGLA